MRALSPLLSPIPLMLLIPRLLATSAAANPPYQPNDLSYFELDAVCEDAAPTRITALVTLGAGFEGVVRALRLDRYLLGVCEPPVQLGIKPLAQLDPGDFTLEWTDPEPIGEFPHRYQAVGIDAEGNEVSLWPSFEYFLAVDYATCGRTAIGHGLLTSDIAPGFLEPCADSCWVPLSFEPGNPLLDPYVDSGEAVLLFGDIYCALGAVEGCWMDVTEVVELECGTVPVPARSWGALKAQYSCCDRPANLTCSSSPTSATERIGLIPSRRQSSAVVSSPFSPSSTKRPSTS